MMQVYEVQSVAHWTAGAAAVQAVGSAIIGTERPPSSPSARCPTGGAKSPAARQGRLPPSCSCLVSRVIRSPLPASFEHTLSRVSTATIFGRPMVLCNGLRRGCPEPPARPPTLPRSCSGARLPVSRGDCRSGRSPEGRPGDTWSHCMPGHWALPARSGIPGCS